MKIALTILISAFLLVCDTKASDSSNDKSSAVKKDDTRATAKRELQSALGKGQKLRVGDLPIAVQESLRRQGIEVSAINAETKKGRTIYKIEGKEHRRLWIDETGKVLKQTGKESAAKAGATRK